MYFITWDSLFPSSFDLTFLFVRLYVWLFVCLNVWKLAGVSNFLYAANEEYDLGLSKREFKIMAGFGGGMAIEGVCGVASGAVATIGE